MPGTRPELIKPGPFGVIAAADSRRGIFDAHNEALLAQAIPVAAVFIGDSITDGWALDVFFQGTGGMLANRGISGDRTPFVRRRFAADVLQLHPRLVVVMIGVNNTWDLEIASCQVVEKPPWLPAPDYAVLASSWAGPSSAGRKSLRMEISLM